MKRCNERINEEAETNENGITCQNWKCLTSKQEIVYKPVQYKVSTYFLQSVYLTNQDLWKIKAAIFAASDDSTSSSCT